MIFAVVWRYFSWSNQTFAMMTLWAAAVYLAQRKINYWIAVIPAAFMSAVSCTYILVAGEGFGPFIARMLSGGALPEGADTVAIVSAVAYPAGIIFTASCLGMFYFKCIRGKASSQGLPDLTHHKRVLTLDKAKVL